MTHLHARHARGFLLMELAIALVVIGGLVALTLPFWNLQSRLETASQDSSRLLQARDALLRQAITGSGLPAPIEFKESAVNNGFASSHRELDEALTPLAAGWPGALPGQLLGVPTLSPLQTAYWYDVQPALRSDAATGFYPLTQALPASGGGTAWSFDPVISQFDPDLNPRLSTGGNASQLCRNLNSLVALEQSIRTYTAGSTALYQRRHINLTLPRYWATGYERVFRWDSALAKGGFTGTIDADDAFENSSAAAFVVVRRQPPALRRLDRMNTVYAQSGVSGLDPTLNARGYDSTPRVSYPASGNQAGFRIYENPLTAASDNPQSDVNDYGGLVKAVSLGEFADSLRDAGLCQAPAEACKANQLYVRIGNYVSSAPPTGTGQGLTLRWELVDQDNTPETVVRTADVSNGSTAAGVCLDAFSTDQADAAARRYLRVSFISPAGSVGYTSGNYWYRGGLLVDPQNTSTLPSADAGVNRWRNLSALSAAEGGKTVTITCTGSHTVSAAGALVNAGPSLPTCTVTQLP